MNKLTETPTDAEIIEYMKDCNHVEVWNERREEVKKLRDQRWIGEYLDGSGLINDSNIPKRRRYEDSIHN